MPSWIADIWLLLGAVVCLFVPRPMLVRTPGARRAVSAKAGAGKQRKLVRRRSVVDETLPGQDELRLAWALRNHLNWMDFARAAVGGYALWQAALDWEWLAPGTRRVGSLGILMAITAVAVIVQMWRREENGTTNFAAPGFFLGGLMVAPFAINAEVLFGTEGMAGLLRGGPGLLVAGFTVVALLAMKFLITNAYAFCGCLAAGYFLTGFLFFRFDLRLMAFAGLAVLPVLMSLLLRRDLIFETVRPPRKTSRPPVPVP